MKFSRILAGTLALLAFSAGAAADIRTLSYSQILDRPPGQTYTEFARSVAIDGASLIVIATHDGGQSALLYQRASGSSRFTYRRVLVNFLEPRENLSVRMKNGIAVVQFGDRQWIFERSGSDYVEAVAEAPLRHPGGVAISNSRILFGGDNCGYDGAVYQKGTDGIWRVTGRLDDNRGQCAPGGLAVELNYDTALIHVPGTSEVTTWRRNGSAIDWVSAGSLAINSTVAATSTPFALQNSTAVTPGSFVFRREGSIWAARGTVVPADYGMGSGNARAVKYRDGVLATSEDWIPGTKAGVYIYEEIAPGEFEHHAILETNVRINDHDVSQRTVVVGTSHVQGGSALIFTLPDTLAAPDFVAADFNDGDASDFTAVSGQFAVAQRGNNRVLAQTSVTNYSVALANSDASRFQLVNALITPAFGASDGFVGLIARYADANNYYYFSVRKNGTAGLYHRVNGVNTLLGTVEGGAGNQWALPLRMSLAVNDGWVTASLNGRNVFADHRSLPRSRGRAGLMTWHAGADFDDVTVDATSATWLVYKRFMPDADVPARPQGREFSRIGGDWHYEMPFPNQIESFQQRDPSRSAFAFLGVPVRNQEIEVSMQMNAVSSETAAWIGLLGRYVDAYNHYYVVLGINGHISIRKRVNNVVTQLASTRHGVDPRQFNTLRFRLAGDQLELFLNGRKVLSAHDDDIREGSHGLATSRAAATYEYMHVAQP